MTPYLTQQELDAILERAVEALQNGSASEAVVQDIRTLVANIVQMRTPVNLGVIYHPYPKRVVNGVVVEWHKLSPAEAEHNAAHILHSQSAGTR